MNVEAQLKTSTPLPLERRSLIHLMLVHNKVNERLNQAVKPFDLSLQQFNVLRILRGRKTTPASMQDLNERMVSKMSNTGRLVDKLLQKELVQREVCPSNRRKVEITITGQGLELLKEVDEAVDAAEHELTKGLEKSELQQLNALLDKF